MTSTAARDAVGSLLLYKLAILLNVAKAVVKVFKKNIYIYNKICCFVFIFYLDD